jgi:hypothetical protein
MPTSVPLVMDEEDENDPHRFQPPVHYNGPEGATARRPKVAIIGPASAFNHRLEDTFPFIDFQYIERGTKEVPSAVSGCDKILGVANFTSSHVQAAIRRTDEGKKKFVVVDGSLSAVKRQINVWINAGNLEVPAMNNPQYATH